MEITHKLGTELVHPLLPVAPPLGYRIAKLVSNVFSPPLLIVIGLALAAADLGSVQAWLWAGFYIAVVVLLPCAYIVWQVRQGNITDFHMKIRAQRTKPLLLSLICSIVAVVVMWVGAAPEIYLVFGGVGILQMALIFCITLKWKISGHSTAVAGFSVFMVALFGGVAAPILLAIPLVAWARVRLNRHEILQTVAGTMAGVIFMWGMIRLIS